MPINYIRGLLSIDEKIGLGDLTRPVAAAATSNPPVPSSNHTDVSGTASPAATGTVVFYRLRRFAGSALEPSVYCNDFELARMDNGRYFKVVLPVGSYVCRSNDQTAVSFDLTPGETRYVRVEIITGFMKGHGAVGEISSRQGALEITKLKPLDVSKIRTQQVEAK